MSLWNLAPSDSKNYIDGILGSSLSKYLGFVKFLYAKGKGWQFSDNVLIFGLYIIANLYRMPRVTVLASDSETNIR